MGYRSSVVGGSAVIQVIFKPKQELKNELRMQVLTELAGFPPVRFIEDGKTSLERGL
jgi:hypothetical protein